MICCTFENGKEALLRHVTVGVIVINTRKEFLLVKRAANLLRGNTYTIPGGFLDRGENLEKGALRELFEETGLTGKHAILFRINSSPDRPKEDRQNVDFIFIVKKFTGDLTNNKEVIEMRWFSEKDLPPDEKFAFDHRESIMFYLEYTINNSNFLL